MYRHSTDVNSIDIARQSMNRECMFTSSDIDRFRRTVIAVSIIRGVITVRNGIALQTKEKELSIRFFP